MVKFVPASTRASGDRPLAAASALLGTPWAMAMPHRVSPGATVWTAPWAAAGASAARASAAPARRAARSMDMT
jgi:hypothetical protein